MLLGPLELAVAHRPYVILAGVLAAAVVFGPLSQGRIQRKHLRTSVTPRHPIMDWERAHTQSRMDEILGAWGEAGRGWALRSLALDLGFLVAYGAAHSLACSVAAVFFRSADGVVGEWIFGVGAWAAVAVAALDLVENALLFRMLRGFQGDRLPGAMALVSRTKWGIGYTVAPFAIVALLVGALGTV